MYKLKRALPFAHRVVWALFFLTLPVTSFPYFPTSLGGKTLVRPLSLYPLLILALTVTLPRLIKKPLPKTFLPFLGFVTLVLLSSILPFARDIEPLFGVSLLERWVRSIITLFVGIIYYFTISLLHESHEDLKFSLRWLYIGFSIALLWGTLQAVYVVHYSPTYFQWMSQLQKIISTRKLFPTRISGMTYEPKWFAEQICSLLLPWLFSSILRKRSAFSWKYKGITVEWLLLVWACPVLVFTFSRTGLFVLALLLVSAFFISRYAHIWKNPSDDYLGWRRFIRPVLETGGIVLGILVVMVVVGSQNPYFSRLWRYWTEAKERNRTYLEFIAFQQRFVYVETAFNIFETHPLFGVGLGNYAFYFDDMLPDELYRSPEITRLTTPSEGRQPLVTPKNLYARLLSESGLSGFFTFLAFLIAIGGNVSYLIFSPDSESKYWGTGGLFALAVSLILAFSSDSLALPNMWVVLGLITSAGHINHPMVKNKPQLNSETLNE